MMVRLGAHGSPWCVCSVQLTGQAGAVWHPEKAELPSERAVVL